MRVITWNVHKKNKRIARALDFIKEQDADVVCLQEFPASHAHLLSHLKGYHITTEDEICVYKDDRRPTAELLIVTASKHPIQRKKTIHHKTAYRHSWTKTDPLYADFRAPSSYVDVELNGKPFRIFNAHFRFAASPAYRMAQFKDILRHIHADRENIICGDLNTYGNPIVNIVLWNFLGYESNDLLTDEYQEFSTLFEVHGFKNPFKNRPTFISLPAQLDYILVPQHTPVQTKRMFFNPRGSDHLPIMIEL